VSSPYANLHLEALLPHRGSMLLVDRVIERRSNGVVCEATPKRQWPFAENSGVPSLLGLELMAQCVGVHVGFLRQEAKEPVRIGFLLGTRHYQCDVAHFTFGQALMLSCAHELSTDAGLAAFVCHLHVDGQQVAQATLNLFQPPDVEAFLATHG
jgi:predicted hotdog family 3-hydroxylacyl-ACP dehydratase